MAQWYPDGYSYPRAFYPPGPLQAQPASRTTNTSGPIPAHANSITPVSAVTRPSPRQGGQTRARVAPTISQQPDPIEGVDYFKIGAMVRVRRYHTLKDEYSSWIPGKVERPVLVPVSGGGSRRNYVVSYTDPITGAVQEKSFSPSLEEISDVPPVHQPAPHSNRIIIFAPVPTHKHNRGIWTPSLVLTRPNPDGFRIRVLAGPAAGQQMSNVKYAIPYTPHHAAEFRRQGHEVEGDGTHMF